MNVKLLNESSHWKKIPVSLMKQTLRYGFCSGLPLLAVFLAMTPLLAQTPKFYGLTSQGGKDGTGAIIEYDINSQTLTDPAPTGFTNFSPGKPLYNDLTEFNGKLYGLTYSGGAYFSGVIFEFNPVDGVYTKKHDFSSNGRPIGGLTELNGKLYGTTSGGLNNGGVIFEFDPLTGVYTEKFQFTSNNGRSPSGSLANLGGTLFGMTTWGGLNNLGVIFSFDPTTDTFSNLHDFDGTDGANPRGGLTVYDGKLYGTTNNGGRDDNGIIFAYSNGVFTNLRSFFISAQGSNALGGSLTLYGDKLYGTTPMGGIADSGLIFEYDPLSNTFDFADVFGGANGSAPYGSLTVFNDKLYGMTSSGGDGDVGVLFEFDPSTKRNTKKWDFEEGSGSSPLGSLEVFDGKLYGMTAAGGSNKSGVIFLYEPSTNAYLTRVDFERTNGSYPTGSLTLYDDILYGMATAGGKGKLGVIFSYDPVSQNYNSLYPFDGISGSKPSGDLTVYDGKLYGMTPFGGVNDQGVIFMYDPASSSFSKLADFDQSSASGGFPNGSLTVLDGKFYGLSQQGGSNNRGVVFEFDPVTGLFTNGASFDDLNGAFPSGSLIAYNGKLYGMTGTGGVDLGGVLFEYDPGSATIVKKVEFEVANGVPYGGLTEYNSKLYGLTSGGGSQGGILFEFDPTLNTYSKKHSFGGIGGRIPLGTLTAYNGKLYGMTLAGGAEDYGVVFEYDPANNSYLKTADFNLINGGMPNYGQLTLFIFPPPELGLSATKVDETCLSPDGSIDLTITGASGTPVISWTGPDTFTADVEDLNNLAAGLYKVVVTDELGTTGTLEVEILLTPDSEIPVIGPVSNISVSVPSGQTVTSVSVSEPSVSDNCSATVTGVRNDGKALTDPYPVGETIITWSAEDPSGNDAVQVIQKVIVTEIVPSLGIAGFTLINAGTDRDMLTLTDGLQISQNEVQGLSLNIRANTNPSVVGSVYITLSGPVNRKVTDNDAPYALFGDKSGNYNGRTLATGTYTLTAQAYSLRNRKGTAGPLKTITFTINSPVVRLDGSQASGDIGKDSESNIAEPKVQSLELMTGALKAYPNPIRDGRVTVQDGQLKSGQVRYTLYSLQGVLIQEGTVGIGEENTITLDFAGKMTHAAMYILVIDNQNYLVPKRVNLIFE